MICGEVQIIALIDRTNKSNFIQFNSGMKKDNDLMRRVL